MKADVLRVIEAAYATGDEQSWLLGIAEAARSAIDVVPGLVAYRFFLGDSKPVVGAYVQLGENRLNRANLELSIQATPIDFARAAFGYNRVSTLTEFLNGQLKKAPFIAQYMSATSFQDGLGIIGIDPSGEGIVLSGGFEQPTELSPAFKRVWSRVVLHLAAGLRLRSGDAGSAPKPEAVLDPDGKVQDAWGPARDPDARVALRQAARAIDRARSSREQDPQAAVELWRALVESRWSVVDWFDSDGRRFLLARPNPVVAQRHRRLTPAEREVTALAALGRSNKLIAYELGVAVGTVGTLLSRAMHKLRLSSRAKLIEYWHAHAADED